METKAVGKRAVYWLRQAVQTALLLLLVSLAVDWWRKPAQPQRFAGQGLDIVNGGQTTLTALSSGRTAAVYFWGSWCGICKHTSPAVQRLHEAGIPVLGVAMHSGSAQEVAAYMQENGLSFDTVNDPQGRISRRWQVAVTPTVVLVKNGRMIHSTTGIGSYWGLRGRIWMADKVY
ncbi:protein disulfide oxidoreductase [Neisseria sp. WF04]|nr:protein disulfide oxidoreductase [Neisseria sp. 19428wB4_WF04]TFU42801.1 protein disulfide oxidoreductase [Neisseria sp. WF04]